MTRWGQSRKADLLGRIPLFAKFSRHQLHQVGSLTAAEELPAGTVLTREGASGGIAFILASGRAEVERRGKRLAVLGPGDVVGELSLIDGKPRSATVRALTDLEVLEIDTRDLTRLLRTTPAVTRKLLEVLAGRIRHADSLPTSGL
jgi:CRP/FNR family transcriptional regulator, cyclic AMP receptor protein